jgi:hypothetical protein
MEPVGQRGRVSVPPKKKRRAAARLSFDRDRRQAAASWLGGSAIWLSTLNW